MSNLLKKSINVKYGKMKYYFKKFENDKPAIILIHGYMSIPTTMLIPYVQDYGYNEHTWYFPLLLGTPESTCPLTEEAHKMEQYAEDIYQMILKEQETKVVIIGFSMGGSISLLLADKILSDKSNSIQITGLFHIEGNIDFNDTNFSYPITKKNPSELDQERKETWKKILKNQDDKQLMIEWVDKNKQLKSEIIIYRSKDLVNISEKEIVLPIVKKYPNEPFYFIYGEKNKGKYSSEGILRKNNCKVFYIPDSGHYVFEDNATVFLDLVYEKIG